MPILGRHSLTMKSKLPKAAYEDYLLNGDIGVSFISTPHPGIVHFQMANFGLTTLTNVTALRTQDWLTRQNRNLLGVDLTVEAISARLADCVLACEDRASRYGNACEGVHISKEDSMAEAVAFLSSDFK